ncbi:MAG TPA: endolytic transglycosylase MltG [Candidatus Sulfotelmatobacter sp.]|nr:endolytic transglycosylase MltG [Candidatus Sulfotelmatobacter sp.]
MKKFFFLIVILILVIGGLGAWWFNGTTPANSADQTIKTFEVIQGENVRQIANNLKMQGLIKDPITFYFLVKQKGIGDKIQAGEFQLSPSMSAGKIADILQLATDDIRITIPEGKRAEEVSAILEAHFSTYQPSWKQQLIVNEGYLFPDTYSFNKNVDINTIISTMEANFIKKYDSIPDGKKSSLTKAQIVTIASIVEREAKFSEDRPLVASVILNRLTAGMPLQVDATIQYALGYQSDQKSWWKTSLALIDLQVNSPFNSYINTGLPPGPISNPGIEALKAVINAPETNYLFYVSDKSGHNHYEVNSNQHGADVKKYGL